MKIMMEIGYTNIKLLINSKVHLYKASILNLNRLVDKYVSRGCLIYICNNNTNLDDELKKLKIKYIENITIVDRYYILNLLQLKDNLDTKQIGLDLLMLCLYLRQSRIKDCILISAGSAIVCLIWKNFELTSATINLGIELSQKAMYRNLKLEPTVDYRHTPSFNTKTALELGNYVIFDGLIKSIRAMFELEDKPCILTGNSITGKLYSPLKDHNENIKYEDNLILKTLASLFDK